MPQSRKLIRDALVDMLATPVDSIYPTDAEANVYSNRSTSPWTSELPLILIFANSESATLRDSSTRQYIRDLSFSIEIHAKANDALDETLDTIADQVESVIHADPSIQGTALSTILTNTEMTLDSEGEETIGKLTLSFETKYIK